MRIVLKTLGCVLVSLIAACTASPAPTPIVDMSSVAVANSVIQWARSPEVIVFRADVVGGARQNTFEGQRDVAWCTVYGDNRVVWVNELGAFATEVLYDRVSDDVIGNFIAYLTINERIYTYEALAPTVSPGVESPVIETVYINVNGIEHRGDGFSGWDREWFARVLRACKNLSQSPVLFEPQNGWLSARESTYNADTSFRTWDPAATGVDLAQVASSGEPVWISGAGVREVWNAQNQLPSQFVMQQGDRYFQVALQVPGISRVSPPAP